MVANSSLDHGQPFAGSGPQEKQVLLLLSQGRQNREIAESLFLGEGTIRNYMHSIVSKLGLAGETEAIAYALKHNLRAHMGLEN